MALSDRSKAYLSGVVVVLFIGMLLLAAEGLIRVRQYVKYGTFGNLSEFKTDPETGLRTLAAGTSSGDLHINRHGFRGPEIEMPKPADRLRIAFLGASTTYCAEIKHDDHVWTELTRDGLEAELPGLSVDYVNGAVPGYTTSASLTNLEQRVAPLRPDVVVIYHATNDLSGETRELATAAGVERVNLGSEQSWLSQYSLLWHLVEKNMALLQAPAPATVDLPLDDVGFGQGFRDNLIRLVERARALGARQVVLVTFSIHLREGMTAAQRDAAMVTARYYMPFLSADGLLTGFGRYNRIIREVAAETGAILVADEHSIPGDTTHFVDSVHFSEQGSRRQAARIVAALTGSEPFLALLKSFRPQAAAAMPVADGAQHRSPGSADTVSLAPSARR